MTWPRFENVRLLAWPSKDLPEECSQHFTFQRGNETETSRVRSVGEFPFLDIVICSFVMSSWFDRLEHFIVVGQCAFGILHGGGAIIFRAFTAITSIRLQVSELVQDRDMMIAVVDRRGSEDFRDSFSGTLLDGCQTSLVVVLITWPRGEGWWRHVTRLWRHVKWVMNLGRRLAFCQSRGVETGATRL